MSRGLPPPAELYKVIRSLFQNEEYNDRNTHTKITFSKAKLTPTQEKSLIYPPGLLPIDFYIIYQIDIIYSNDKTISSTLELVSFTVNGDGYIYGVYFSVSNQPSFCISELSQSKVEIELSEQAIFNSSDYLEVYNNILGTIVILALSTLNPSTSSLQYSHGSHYKYEQLAYNGIVDTHIPKIKLTGLSNNLEKHCQ